MCLDFPNFGKPYRYPILPSQATNTSPLVTPASAAAPVTRGGCLLYCWLRAATAISLAGQPSFFTLAVLLQRLPQPLRVASMWAFQQLTSFFESTAYSMRYLLLLLPPFLLATHANAQPASKCNCNGLVNVEFKGKINVYNKPNGKIIKTYNHDFKNESFLIFTIDKDSAGYFLVEIENALSSNKSGKGWVKKSNELGVYARNYSNPLSLYSKPSLKSPLKSVIADWNNGLYVISRCSGKWAYVRLMDKGQMKEGWMEPNMQCANPYTTCN